MRGAWLAIAATLALAMAAAPAPVVAASGTVTGTLIGEEGDGLSGQTVSACGPPGCVSAQFPSDKDGHYSIALPSGVNWNLQAGDCHQYALAHKYDVNVSDGGRVTINLHMTKRWGAISGRVLDQSGAPVAGVALLVDNGETGGSGFGWTTSAADGTYTAGCLAAGGVAGSGSYFITVGPPAGSPYGSQQDSGIKVEPGKTTNHDVILHKGGGGITGHVRCNGGRCPAGASILIYCEGCSSSANTAVDQSGGYALGHLTAGQKYDVHAVAPAGWDNAIHYGVSVREGNQTTIDFNLVRSGSASSGRLTGHISDAAGGAHNQCLINAFGGIPGTSVGGWTDGDVHTGSDGLFDTDYELVPGDYLIFLVCPGWPQVQLNGGRALNVKAGAATNVDYVLGQGWVATSAESPRASVPTTTAFFAAGSTSFTPSVKSQESLMVTNPGEAQTLTATYLFAGAPPIIRQYALPAAATLSINVNAEIGADRDVSVSLAAPQPFLVDRSLTMQTSDGINGTTQVAGSPALNPSWFFASGSTAQGFNESLVLMNPNSNAASVGVVYTLPDGTSRTVCHAVPAMGRSVISVNAATEAGNDLSEVMATVFADTPILAERESLVHDGTGHGLEDAVGSTSESIILNISANCAGGGMRQYLAMLGTHHSGPASVA